MANNESKQPRIKEKVTSNKSKEPVSPAEGIVKANLRPSNDFAPDNFAISPANTAGQLSGFGGFTETQDVDAKTVAIFLKKGYKVKNRIAGADGNFSLVYIAQHIRKEIWMACKVINMKEVSQYFKDSFLPRELECLIKVKHQYIIKTYDIFHSKEKVYIFMEFAAGGTLASVLKKTDKNRLEEKDMRRYFEQVAMALDYLHNELKICHRDIKTENVLLDKDNNCKLSDFGFARNLDGLSDTYCGTEPYFSPEIVAQTPYDPTTADMYAMGVLLFVLMNNRFPFHYNSQDKNISLKEQEKLNLKWRTGHEKVFSKLAKETLFKLLSFKEKNRWTAKQLVDSPWFK